jgi:hypothetical protein
MAEITRRRDPEAPDHALGGIAWAPKMSNRWSMKYERELIRLAKTQTLQAISDKLQCPSVTVLERAAQLGIKIKREKAKGK